MHGNERMEDIKYRACNLVSLFRGSKPQDGDTVKPEGNGFATPENLFLSSKQ